MIMSRFTLSFSDEDMTHSHENKESQFFHFISIRRIELTDLIFRVDIIGLYRKIVIAQMFNNDSFSFQS